MERDLTKNCNKIQRKNTEINSTPTKCERKLRLDDAKHNANVKNIIIAHL